MKSPVASSSICTRSKASGLNCQSNPSRVFSSAKCASRMRRATPRSRRALACAPNSRSRNCRWGRPSFSARDSSSSSAAGSSGMPSVAQWLKHWSRSGVVTFVVVVFAVFCFIAMGRFFQQRADTPPWDEPIRGTAGRSRRVVPALRLPATPTPSAGAPAPPGSVPPPTRSRRGTGRRVPAPAPGHRGGRWPAGPARARPRFSRSGGCGPVRRRTARRPARTRRSAPSAVRISDGDRVPEHVPAGCASLR